MLIASHQHWEPDLNLPGFSLAPCQTTSLMVYHGHQAQRKVLLRPALLLSIREASPLLTPRHPLRKRHGNRYEKPHGNLRKRRTNLLLFLDTAIATVIRAPTNRPCKVQLQVDLPQTRLVLHRLQISHQFLVRDHRRRMSPTKTAPEIHAPSLRSAFSTHLLLLMGSPRRSHQRSSMFNLRTSLRSHNRKSCRRP
jgi:hypothetical protein